MRRVLRLGLALLAALALLSGETPAFAQEGEDDHPLIVSHHVEIVFPSVIRFYLEVSPLVEDLSQVNLVFEQGERTLRQGEIDLDSAALTVDSYTALRFDWPIPVADPPALFEPITYRWTVAAADETEDEIEDEFDFQELYTWEHGGEPPLQFSLPDSAVNAGVARRALLTVYDLLNRHTGLEPSFRWVVFPFGHTFCREIMAEEGSVENVIQGPVSEEIFPCDEADAERIYAENGYRLLRRSSQPGLLPFENEMIDDMVPVFYGDFWQGVAVPAWFQSGLRQLYHVTSDPLGLRQTQNAARADSLFGADRLDVVPRDAGDRAAWERQAYTMVLYLADAYGAEAPFSLAQALSDEDFDTAFSDLTGGDRRDFLVAWERWLFTERAENAVRWTVYSPATPTPAPTGTASPPLPTRTSTPPPTATPSPSPTATATSIIAQFPTPLPTNTATRAITATPSNTPRPPGSLNQPQGGGSSGGGGGGCLGGPAALLLPGAALVMIQVRKRRG